LVGNKDFPDSLQFSPMISHGLAVVAKIFCSISLVLGLFTYLAIFLTGAGKYSIDTKVFM
jgi:uncharacterized membrane protein YphA (DoxX/SURF4 family)